MGESRDPESAVTSHCAKARRGPGLRWDSGKKRAELPSETAKNHKPPARRVYRPFSCHKARPTGRCSVWHMQGAGRLPPNRPRNKSPLTIFARATQDMKHCGLNPLLPFQIKPDRPLDCFYSFRLHFLTVEKQWFDKNPIKKPLERGFFTVAQKRGISVHPPLRFPRGGS